MRQPLTPRQEEILTQIIESHIATSQPVGSRALAERYGLGLSSASVRHEMGILEEQGYLTHPHTSAGRVPTDLGYRFYVSERAHEEPVSQEVVQWITRELEDEVEDPENLMGRVSRILSTLVQETALLMAPDRFPEGPRPRLFVEGSRFILDQPEFQDLKKFRTLIAILEEKSDLIHLLTPDPREEGVRVVIGAEELSEGLWDCALVRAPYLWHGKSIGTLGVLGPRRMPYGRVMGLVHQMSDGLSQILARWGE